MYASRMESRAGPENEGKGQKMIGIVHQEEGGRMTKEDVKKWLSAGAFAIALYLLIFAGMVITP
jgi:hypothetical protein